MSNHCKLCRITELRDARYNAEVELHIAIGEWCDSDAHEFRDHGDGNPWWCDGCEYGTDGWRYG